MKKLASVLLTLAMIASLAVGCAPAQPAQTAEPAPAAEAPAAEAPAAEPAGTEPEAAAATSPVFGIDDPEVAAALMEVNNHAIYTKWCVDDTVATDGIRRPILESRASVDKAIPEDAGSRKPEDVTIGYSLYGLVNDWFIGTAEGAQAAADEMGVKLVLLDANGDGEKRLANIETLVAMGVDGVMFGASDVGTADKMAGICAESGVMSVGMGVTFSDSANAITTILPSSFSLGYKTGLVAGKALEGRHVVTAAALSKWGSSSGEGRATGVIAGVFDYRSQQANLGYSKEDCWEKAIEFWQTVRSTGKASSDEFDFEVVYVEDGGFSEETGITIAENAFAAHSDINLFICNNDAIGIGVATTAKDMGITLGEGGVQLVSPADGMMKAYEMIQNGEYLATCNGAGYATGYAGVKLLANILINGYDANDLTALTFIDETVITKDNVGQYYDASVTAAPGIEPVFMTVAEYNQQSARELGLMD